MSSGAEANKAEPTGTSKTAAMKKDKPTAPSTQKPTAAKENNPPAPKMDKPAAIRGNKPKAKRKSKAVSKETNIAAATKAKPPVAERDKPTTTHVNKPAGTKINKPTATETTKSTAKQKNKTASMEKEKLGANQPAATKTENPVAAKTDKFVAPHLGKFEAIKTIKVASKKTRKPAAKKNKTATVASKEEKHSGMAPAQPFQFTFSMPNTSNQASASSSCSACSLDFANQKSLDRHVCSSAQKIPQHSCLPCELRFLDEASLQRHLSSIAHGIEPTLKSVCSDCNLNFYDHSSLERHLSSIIHTALTYRCDCCKFRSLSRAEFDAHIQSTTHLPPIYLCEPCEEVFSIPFLFSQHLASEVHKRLAYQTCGQCDCSFLSKPALESHEAKVHILNVEGMDGSDNENLKGKERKRLTKEAGTWRGKGKKLVESGIIPQQVPHQTDPDLPQKFTNEALAWFDGEFEVFKQIIGSIANHQPEDVSVADPSLTMEEEEAPRKKVRNWRRAQRENLARLEVDALPSTSEDATKPSHNTTSRKFSSPFFDRLLGPASQSGPVIETPKGDVVGQSSDDAFFSCNETL